MKTIIHISVTLVTLFLLASSGYSQTLGFSYQAVIINPEVQVLPGNDIYGGVLAESEVSLRFSIDSYQEEHFLTTDKYGMISLMVGQGDVLSGDFNSIVWDGSGISLLVEIDFSATGDEYEDLDTHMLTYTPHPMTNEELEWIEGIELNVEINALAIIAEEARALAAEALIQADVDLNESDSDSADASIQADVDQNELDSDAADAAIQADVDQNELDSDAADVVIQSDVDQNESDSDAADAAIQADVDLNESDSDLADDAIQADADQNELDSDSADAVIQADVDQNEVDSDSADAVIQADVDQNEVDSDLADAAIQADVDQNESDSDSADAAIQADVDLNTASIENHNTADEDLSSLNEIQDLGQVLIIGNDANGNNIVNTGQIGIGTATPNAKSSIEIATALPVIFPSMTQAQVDNISSPVQGMVQYNTTANKLQVYSNQDIQNMIANELYSGTESGMGPHIQSVLPGVTGNIVAVEVLVRQDGPYFEYCYFDIAGEFFSLPISNYTSLTWHTFYLPTPVAVTAGNQFQMYFDLMGSFELSFATNSSYLDGSGCCFPSQDDMLFRIHIETPGGLTWVNMH